MVFTRLPLRSYTVTVWRYIMFCANTSPRSDATTDFGEMSPVIVRDRDIAPDDDGIGSVVEVVDVLELDGVPRSVEVAFAGSSEPPAPSHASAPRATRERTRATRTGTARLDTG